MTRITGWIMRLAPIGVFGLVTKVIYQTGSEAIRPLLIFSVTVVAALLIHVAIVLPLLMRFSGASAWKHYKNMAPALLTAFSTSSSTATLPVSVECVIEGSGVSRRVASFSLPLGATMNMDGTALYECVAALFIAQAYGLDLSFGQQALILILALLTSIGVAGIPSASLVAIALILGAIGLPLEAAGVILAVDRILDMLRTSVNVLGDSTCAVVVARFEGEVTNVALEPA